MKVKELIAKLQEQDPEMEVFCESEEGWQTPAARVVVTRLFGGSKIIVTIEVK